MYNVHCAFEASLERDWDHSLLFLQHIKTCTNPRARGDQENRDARQRQSSSPNSEQTMRWLEIERRVKERILAASKCWRNAAHTECHTHLAHLTIPRAIFYFHYRSTIRKQKIGSGLHTLEGGGVLAGHLANVLAIAFLSRFGRGWAILFTLPLKVITAYTK